jgi:uncharacterized RDD family membrane protein YckC
MHAAYTASEQSWIPSPGLLAAAERAEYPRMGAALADLIIVVGLHFLTGQVVGVVGSGSGSNDRYTAGLGFDMYIHNVPAAPLAWLLVVGVGYFLLFEALFAATPGKALAGLSVVALDGTRPTPRAILIRNVLRPIDTWPFFYIAGAVFARFSRQPQRLGDAAARTLVVAVADLPAQFRATRHPRRALLVVAALALLLAALGAAYIYLARPPLVVAGWQSTNNSYSFTSTATDGSQPSAFSLPCGAWRNGFDGDIIVGDSVTLYTLGDPQRTGDTLTYPIDFTTAHTHQLQHGTITLRWMGLLSGGWVVVSGSTAC